MDNIIGRKLDGRYEIKEIIGIGGMAVVYKAYDSIDDRIVAVKVLKEEYLTNVDFRRRFKNESKAIAVLSHPNIVKVYDVSLGERIQYIVMEYIDGITLKEYIDQQHVLTWKEALHFTVQILRALEHAHEKGIIHRDIKPQNIMMLEDGTIKVTDFGIARFASSETRTMTDKAIGSVHYISPEQARGAETDEKSDIYSVGVMLYEMLTGQLPFESENAVSVAIMQMQQEPKRPREINDKIPEGLEDITLRAMQKDPLQRYESSADMLADIDEFKHNPSIHFEYKYFVDDNPTKYVDAINKAKGTPELPEKGKEEKPKKKTRKIGVIPLLSGIAAGIVIITLVVILFAMKSMGFIFNSSGATVAVPNLIGKTYDQVSNDTALTKKWAIVKDNELYNDQPKGTIIKQDPGKGEMVKAGATIKVTVSKGPNVVTIPDESNKNYTDAQADLQGLGFTVTTQGEYSDVTKNNYIKTNPAAGTSAQYGSTIVLTYSLGPATVYKTVPDLTKYNASNVQSAIETAGFKIGNKTYAFNAATYGTICGQSVAANTQSEQNTTINVTISAGPDPGANVSSGQALSAYMSAVSSTNSGIKSNISFISQLNQNQITINNYSGYQYMGESLDTGSGTLKVTVLPSLNINTGDTVQDTYSALQKAGYTNISIVSDSGANETTSSSDLVTAITGTSSKSGTSLIGQYVKAGDAIYIHTK